MSLLHDLVLAATWLVLLYVAVVSLSYTAALVAAVPRLARLRRRLQRFHLSEAASAATAPPLTLLAPMYNEEAVCVEAVRALLGVEYPSFEVVVINDGSKDGTVARLSEAFDLVPTPRAPTAHIPTSDVRRVLRSRTHPALWVLDKANGGRADAQNAGVNYVRTPLFVMLDGDSLLNPDALLRAVQPFLDDDRTVASGGTIGIVNDCTVRHGRVVELRMPRRWLARFQVLEYIRAFAAARVGWSAMDALLIVSGAFGVFLRDAVVEVGGLDRTTIGEDMELVTRLHMRLREGGRDYRVAYTPEAVSWTECPETRAVLGRQRDRWHRGLAEVLWRHRRMLFNPRYGAPGMLAYPHFLFVELLGPVVEAAGYVLFALGLALGVFTLKGALALLVLALALGLLQSVSAIAMEGYAFRRYTRLRDLGLLLFLAVAENAGYRQLTVWWRLRGLWKYIRKDGSWGEMTRVGFKTADAPGSAPARPAPPSVAIPTAAMPLTDRPVERTAAGSTA